MMTFEKRRHLVNPQATLPGRSVAWRQLIERLRAIASSRVSVLFEGERGCGKWALARALHDQSPRAKEPFIPISCHRSGRPASSLLAPLHRAERGTVYLSEIDQLPGHLQGTLLRFLEQGQYTASGGIQICDVRITASSRRPLQELVLAGQFLDDLLYRAGMFTVRVPSLRERREDIPLLAAHFMGIHAGREGHRAFSNAALQALASYHWPGNVRELQACIANLFGRFPAAKGPIDLEELATVLPVH